ncbi:MAG: DMT family transporter [Zoogloeaceae bacterium]|jgi:drug/metabolite transporter (DMT)-like permease|nr:DMT family transporter [Zoogloeaceae bacterium]
MNEHSSPTPFHFCLFLAVAILWGLNWQVVKSAMPAIPPFWLRGASTFLGGLGLLLMARMKGRSIRPAQGEIKILCWLSLWNITLWGAFSAYGVLLLPSGRAALLAFTMPVWSVLLSVCWLHETLGRRRLVGLILGSLGVFALMASRFSLDGALAGSALMLGAAVSWAVGVVSIKRFPVVMPPYVFVGWMMTLGSLPLMLAAFLFEGVSWPHPGASPMLGFLYMTFISGMLCSWAWNYLVLKLPVAVSSLSSLLTPLVGVAGGMLILGEKPGFPEFLGAAFILGAVLFVTSRSADS